MHSMPPAIPGSKQDQTIPRRAGNGGYGDDGDSDGGVVIGAVTATMVVTVTVQDAIIGDRGPTP